MGKHIDYTAHKVHKLTVTGDSGKRVKGEKIWDAICECGNKTTIRSSQIKAGRKKSCGCAVKGRVFSEEGKKALSDSKIGKYRGEKSPHWKGGKNKCEDCGKGLSNRYGKWCDKCKHTHINNTERADKISTSTRGVKKSLEHVENVKKALKKVWTDEKRLSVSGENSHNWKGGHRKDKRRVDGYWVWRDNVFNRDNYTCQCCGERGGELQAHHIHAWKTHKAKRFDVENGATLCKSCHIEFHRVYGLKGFTPENYFEYVKQEKVA